MTSPNIDVELRERIVEELRALPLRDEDEVQRVATSLFEQAKAQGLAARTEPLHVHRWASNETYDNIPYIADKCLDCGERRIESHVEC